jgi:hypothetical protein
MAASISLARPHAEILPKPALKRRQDKVGHEQEAFSFPNHLANVQVLPVISLRHRRVTPRV